MLIRDNIAELIQAALKKAQKKGELPKIDV
jgi:hypothetical protein